MPACNAFDECSGGSGEGDGIVAVAVASAIVGVLALATYRHFAK